MPRPLIAERHVRPAVAIAGIATLALLALSGWLHDVARTGFDDWTGRQIHGDISRSLGQILLGFSAPSIAVFVCAIVTVCAALTHRWDVVAFAVTAPVLAVVLCELVGKPLVGRILTEPGSFPSGHETGACSAALVLGVTLARLPISRRAQLTWRIGLMLWVLVCGVGLVRAGYHYATDVLGAIALCVAVVVTTALAIDRLPTKQPTKEVARVS